MHTSHTLTDFPIHLSLIMMRIRRNQIKKIKILVGCLAINS